MDQLTPIDRALDAPVLPGGLDTPAVVIDLDRVDANIARMRTLLDGRGVDLRPHAETHTSPLFAERQLDAGIEDVVVAYPVWVIDAKARRVRELAGRIRLAVGVGSVEGDVGLALRGVFTHGGHASRGPDRVVDAATDEESTLDAAVGRLRDAEALATDEPGWLAGHGVVPQLPGAVITSVSDHHAVLDLPPDLPPLRVGDVVPVVPNHACPVVNLTDELVLTRDGEHVEDRPVLARGRTR